MGIVLLLFGLGMLCFLLWYCTVFALPLWVGSATGFWALAHGAGGGAIVIGLVAGVAVFVLGRYAAAGGNRTARWLAVAAFTLPAAYAGFNVVSQLGEAAVPSAAWRATFAIAGGIAVGATAFVRLVARTNNEVPHRRNPAM